MKSVRAKAKMKVVLTVTPSKTIFFFPTFFREAPTRDPDITIATEVAVMMNDIIVGRTDGCLTVKYKGRNDASVR